MNVKKLSLYLLYVSTGYFCISVILAIIFRPEYRFFDQFLSILGTGDLGWIFNIPLMSLGFTVPLYYYTFYKHIRSEYTVPVSFSIGTFLAIPTSFLLFFIGFFPVEGTTADIHNFLAFLYFILLMIYLAFYFHSFYQLQRSVELQTSIFKHLKWVVFVTSGLILLGLVGPSWLAYTLQKVTVALTLYFQVRSSLLLSK